MSEIVPYRVGEWLPSDHAVLDNWLKALVEEVDSEEVGVAGESGHLQHPVLQEFKELIENDAEVNMLFTQMFHQPAKKYPYHIHFGSGDKWVRDYDHMLRLINRILTKAPEFSEKGLVGFPINAILDRPMATTSGLAAFMNAKVNYYMKKILCEWGTFLKSEHSCYVLNEDPEKGWFGRDARKKMPDFEIEFKCDPAKPYHGFKSWDDFFTRQFRDGVRPIASPDDDNVIVNACESAPYKLARDVQRRDKFWIKSQPYSLEYMLAKDPLAPKFVGGTVYQAFLSALSYHRWHSPVNGKIIKAFVKEGTYYSEARSEGFDPEGPNDSQAYITSMATRAVVFIEADNPNIGLMCFMAIGMAEVSSCEITAWTGQRVKKGQQIGLFHYGGSTHCLLFQPGVKLEFDFHGQEPGLHAENIPVNAKIAGVITAKL